MGKMGNDRTNQKYRAMYVCVCVCVCVCTNSNFTAKQLVWKKSYYWMKKEEIYSYSTLNIEHNGTTFVSSSIIYHYLILKTSFWSEDNLVKFNKVRSVNNLPSTCSIVPEALWYLVTLNSVQYMAQIITFNLIMRKMSRLILRLVLSKVQDFW